MQLAARARRKTQETAQNCRLESADDGIAADPSTAVEFVQACMPDQDRQQGVRPACSCAQPSETSQVQGWIRPNTLTSSFIPA